MALSSSSPFYKMLSELSRFKLDKEDMIIIGMGIKNEDIVEFTNIIQQIKTNDYDALMSKFLKFRQEKQYE